MVIRPAQFDFLELYTWNRLILNEVWPDYEIRMLDIDEVENRIQIAVGQESEIGPVRSALVDLGIPAQALQVGTRGPTVLTSTITENATNEVGGHRIDFWWGLDCSIGFNLNRSTDAYKYFVTAAHCTDGAYEIGEMLSRAVSQPDSTDPVIGTEVSDPDLFTHAADSICPSGDDCRYSDAALVKYNGNGNPLLGEVADLSSGFYYNSTIHVIAEHDPDVGDYVEMTGASSGKVTSSISDTCVHVPISTNSSTYLCQFVAEDSVGVGDSGGPVLHWYAPLQSHKMHAVGILVAQIAAGSYAGTSWGAGSLLSGMDKVLDELEADYGGQLSADIDQRPDPNVYYTSGPYTMPSGLLCTWTASASGGVPPYSYTWSNKLSGTGASIDGIINSDGWLTVTVTDDVGHTDQVSRYIDIDEGADVPGSCSE
jgi:hypothetical protein